MKDLGLKSRVYLPELDSNFNFLDKDRKYSWSSEMTPSQEIRKKISIVRLA